VLFFVQPLDAPGTLRPLLYSFATSFVWQTRPWHMACYGWLALPAALAILNFFGWPKLRILRLRTLFFLAIAFALFICRLPALLVSQMNPDEAQFLAAAEKLFVDPVFFRAVDTGTSGPLNIYPLMLPALAGLSPDFASGRAVGLLAIFASVYVVYRTFLLLAPDATARIATLPAAGAFCVLTNWDFLHYSSEHISFTLIAGAAFLLVGVVVEPQRAARRCFGLGVLISAAFFAKMQALPIIAAAALFALVYVRRHFWMLILGMLPIPAVIVAMCLVTGVAGDFWEAYIVANYSYAQVAGQPIGWSFHYMAIIREIHAMMIVCAAVFLLVRRPISGAVRWSAAGFAMITIATLFAIDAPHRAFVHYLLLLILPLTILTALPIMTAPLGRWRAMFFCALVVGGQLFLWHGPYPYPYPDLPRVLRSAEGDFIRASTQPGDQIVSWGWNADPYISSGRVAGTRDTNMANFFSKNPAVETFYRARFMRDMQRTRPALFIDTTGPASFPGDYGIFKNRELSSFVVFPEIRDYISREYEFVGERDGHRFYRRR